LETLGIGFFKQTKKETLVKKKKQHQGGEMNQALYAHMNNKRKMKKKHLGQGKVRMERVRE
jgi:hypothetical protein